MLQLKKLRPKDLTIGMFVSSLDRPWLSTSYGVQGITIRSDEDIAELHELCDHVFIDLQRSLPPELIREHAIPTSRAKARIRRQSAKTTATNPAPPKKRARMEKSEYLEGRTLTTYQDQTDWPSEYPEAVTAIDSLSESAIHVFQGLAFGSGLDVASIKRSVNPMIESVSRNPDACIWLARLKRADNYTYRHSVACSIWAVVMGRQLGLPKDDLRSLAIGGLLFDVGKLKVPAELLNSPRRLEGRELEQVRQHVDHGVEMAASKSKLNPDISTMILQHHERYDGSGYPNALANNEIHVFARIAGIVDCYDAMTSQRSYAPAISPSHAIKYLHKVKDIEFQAELVEEFTQAVGIYPAGTIVELSSGEVGVVVSEYRSRRLRPRVMVLRDTDKKPLTEIQALDLLETTQDEAGEPLDIMTSLPPGAYDIDLTDLGF